MSRLYNLLEDHFERYIGSGDSLFGEEIHDKLMRVEKDLKALMYQTLDEVLSHGGVHTPHDIQQAFKQKVEEL